MADPAYIVDGVLTDGEAWVGIATTTLGSDTASITFTSTDDGQVGDFSQYMDLMAISYWRSSYDLASTDIPIQNLNGDSTTGNYAAQMFYGNGSSVTAEMQNEEIGSFIASDNATANVFSALTHRWFDINSGKYKASLHRSNGVLGSSKYVGTVSSTWFNQAPITSITLTVITGPLKTGSQSALFGLLPRMVV